MGGSLRAVRQLSPRGIVPNHYDRLDPELHRRKFDRLMEKREMTAPVSGD